MMQPICPELEEYGWCRMQFIAFLLICSLNANGIVGWLGCQVKPTLWDISFNEGSIWIKYPRQDTHVSEIALWCHTHMTSAKGKQTRIREAVGRLLNLHEGKKCKNCVDVIRVLPLSPFSHPEEERRYETRFPRELAALQLKSVWPKRRRRRRNSIWAGKKKESDRISDKK